MLRQEHFSFDKEDKTIYQIQSGSGAIPRLHVPAVSPGTPEGFILHLHIVLRVKRPVPSKLHVIKKHKSSELTMCFP